MDAVHAQNGFLSTLAREWGSEVERSNPFAPTSLAGAAADVDFLRDGRAYWRRR